MPNELDSIEDRRRFILDALATDGEVSDELGYALFRKYEGSLTTLHVVFGKTCSSTNIIDICGRSTTGADGTIEIPVKDFVCLGLVEDEEETLAPPVFFVATPRSDSPASLTFKVNVDEDSEIAIKVFSWSPVGEPAATVRFDWHCCLKLLRQFVVD